MLQIIFYLIILKTIGISIGLLYFIFFTPLNVFLIFSFLIISGIVILSDLLYIIYFRKKNSFIEEYPKLTLTMVNAAVRDDIEASELEEVLR